MSESSGWSSYDGLPETARDKAEFDSDKANLATEDFRKRFDEKMGLRYKNLRDKDQAFIDEVYSAFGSGDPTKVTEILDNTDGDRHDYVLWIGECKEEFDTLEKTVDFMDARYAEYVREDLETEVLEVVSRIDFDKALSNILRKGNIYDLESFMKNVAYVREVQHMVVTEDGAQNLGLFELTVFRDRLRAAREDMKVGDFLSHGSDLEYDLEGIADEPNMEMKAVRLQSEVVSLKQAVKAYAQKANLFVWGSGSFSFDQEECFDSLFNALSNAYKPENYVSDYAVKKPDPRFFESAEKWLIKKRRQFERIGVLPPTDSSRYENQKERESNDKEAIIAGIVVKGFDNDPYLTNESVRLTLKSIVPGETLKKVKSIVFLEGKANTSPRYAGRPKEETDMVAGTCFYEFDDNEGELVGAAIEIYGEDESGKLETHQNRHSIWHEIGHVAHQSMSASEIEDWQRIRTDEVFRITTYVPREKVTKPLEDFTETFTYFIDQPTLLKVIAPERYKFMKKFFEDRSTDAEKTVLNNYLAITEVFQEVQWKSQNLSHAEIAEVWRETVPQD